MSSLCAAEAVPGGRPAGFYFMGQKFAGNPCVRNFPFLPHRSAAKMQSTPSQGPGVASLQLSFTFFSFSRSF